jgi:hypothetical protein
MAERATADEVPRRKCDSGQLTVPMWLISFVADATRWGVMAPLAERNGVAGRSGDESGF